MWRFGTTARQEPTFSRHGDLIRRKKLAAGKKTEIIKNAIIKKRLIRQSHKLGENRTARFQPERNRAGDKRKMDRSKFFVFRRLSSLVLFCPFDKQFLVAAARLNNSKLSFYKVWNLTIMLERLNRSDASRMRQDLETAIEYLPGLASLALWCRFADTDEEVIAYTDGKTIYAGAG